MQFSLVYEHRTPLARFCWMKAVYEACSIDQHIHSNQMSKILDGFLKIEHNVQQPLRFKSINAIQSQLCCASIHARARESSRARAHVHVRMNIRILMPKMIRRPGRSRDVVCTSYHPTMQ